MIKEKNNNLKISCAGYTIDFVFTETDEYGYTKALIEQIKKVWGAFLVRTDKKADFNLYFTFGPDRILVKKQNYYSLIASRDFKHKRIVCPVSISLLSLNLLLKEILAHLLIADGFFLHASSFLDSKGYLHLFLAPSGGGKSTVVRLLADKDQLFSDDILLVKRVGKKWLFYSPPLIEKGKHLLNLSSAKVKIYLIKKAQRATMEEILDKQGVLKEIISKIWFSHPEVPPATLRQIVRFVKENRFWRFETVLDRVKLRKVFINEN